MAEEPAVRGLGSFDVAIIGAGPAGSMLARLLDPSLRVLLVDQRNLDETEPRFRKACGGLVAPDAQAMLARLGLGLPQSVLVGPQLFAVRALDLQTNLSRMYQRFYFNIDRERFDRWLASLVPERVQRCFSVHLSGIEGEGGDWRLVLKDPHGPCDARARVVIGADGARSKVRHLLGDGWPGGPRTYLAVQEWFEVEAPPPCFSVVFDARITDFYAWTIPKGQAVLLGAALAPGPGAGQVFDGLREELLRRGWLSGKRIHREAHPILRPVLGFRPARVPEQVLLIGEAGGYISPSSAEGFSFAFRSAVMAAEVLNAGLEAPGARFHRAASGLRATLRVKSLKSPFMYHPGLRRLIMASGLQHLPLMASPRS